MKVLNEKYTTTIKDHEEAVQFMKDMEENTFWYYVKTNELEVLPLNNEPLLLSHHREHLGVSEDVSDDSLRETMETTQYCVRFPLDQGNLIFPTGETIYRTLLEKSGYEGSKSVGPNSPMLLNDKVSTLNKGLKLYSTKSLVMIRDEKVRAILSGNEYCILSFSEITSLVYNILSEEYKDVRFKEASFDHSVSSAYFEIRDKDINDRIKSAFLYSGKDVNNAYIGVRVISSDIGEMSCSIFPYLISDNVKMMLGSPVRVSHRCGHSISDVEADTRKIILTLVDMEDKFIRLEAQKVKYPLQMFFNYGVKTTMSKKAVAEKAIEVSGMYGNSCSQLDVFWEMQQLFTDLSADMNQARQIQIQANIAREVDSLTKYDIPFNL